MQIRILPKTPSVAASLKLNRQIFLEERRERPLRPCVRSDKPVGKVWDNWIFIKITWKYVITSLSKYGNHLDKFAYHLRWNNKDMYIYFDCFFFFWGFLQHRIVFIYWLALGCNTKFSALCNKLYTEKQIILIKATRVK